MSKLRDAAQQALEALEYAHDESLDDDHFECRYILSGQITALRAALAEQPAEQEPVAWLPSAEWAACVKLPVTVHVRQQRPGETHVSTREGITPVKPDDLIMRGVSGEEYPIGREIFERTYRLGEAPQPKAEQQEPVEATPYNLKRIAWELERTAVGDGFYGNALRVAKDIPDITPEDRSVLDRYATGTQTGTDHVHLQWLAQRLRLEGAG